VVGSTWLSIVSSAPFWRASPILSIVGLHRKPDAAPGAACSTVGMLSSGIVKITVIGWSWVMMTGRPYRWRARCSRRPPDGSPTRPAMGEVDATVDELTFVASIWPWSFLTVPPSW